MHAIRFFNCAVVALSCLPLTAVQAQTVYRCGNAYSQTPCPGASLIAVDDSRSAEQKAQTDAAATQAARQADRMERERLARERAADRVAAKARVPASIRSNTKPALAPRATHAKEKPGPSYFTASTGYDPKKKPPASSGD